MAEISLENYQLHSKTIDEQRTRNIISQSTKNLKNDLVIEEFISDNNEQSSVSFALSNSGDIDDFVENLSSKSVENVDLKFQNYVGLDHKQVDYYVTQRLNKLKKDKNGFDSNNKAITDELFKNLMNKNGFYSHVETPKQSQSENKTDLNLKLITKDAILHPPSIEHEIESNSKPESNYKIT